MPLAIVLGAIAAPVSQAAETITLRYGPLGGAVPVADLATWVDRGELSNDLTAYLGLSQQPPDRIRKVLSQRITMPAFLVDRALSSRSGEVLLSQLGQVLQAPKTANSSQALRQAVVAAAEDDGRISLLEVLQRHPAQNVDLRVDRLISLAETWNQWRNQGSTWLEQLTQWGDRLRQRR